MIHRAVLGIINSSSESSVRFVKKAVGGRGAEGWGVAWGGAMSGA